MKFVKPLVITLVLISGLNAFPRWSVREDASCNTCHLYQGGGAARNATGKEFSQYELSRKSVQLPWVDPESESPFSGGVDARYMIIQESGRDLRQFPMQLALYGGAEFGSFIAHAEVNRLQEAFRLTGGLRYEGLPLESYLAIQREMPAIGWRIDDHTLYSRGGNLTPLHFDQEGMPFTPFLDPPVSVEVGTAPVIGLELSASLGEGFLRSDQILDETSFLSLKGSYRWAGEFLIAQLGAGLMKEGDLSLRSGHMGISAWGLVWLSEVSALENWTLDGATKLSIMHQVSAPLIQGAEFVARYEFYDPDSDFLSGSLSRYSVGVDLFLVSGLEMKLSYRTAQLDGAGDDTSIEPQILSQIHFYF